MNSPALEKAPGDALPEALPVPEPGSLRPADAIRQRARVSIALWTFVGVVAVLFAVAVAFAAVRGHIYHKPAPYDTFLFDPKWRFNDLTIYFARTHRWAMGQEFYASWDKFKFLYLPPAFLPFWALFAVGRWNADWAVDCYIGFVVASAAIVLGLLIRTLWRVRPPRAPAGAPPGSDRKEGGPTSWEDDLVRRGVAPHKVESLAREIAPGQPVAAQIAYAEYLAEHLQHVAPGARKHFDPVAFVEWIVRNNVWPSDSFNEPRSSGSGLDARYRQFCLSELHDRLARDFQGKRLKTALLERARTIEVGQPEWFAAASGASRREVAFGLLKGAAWRNLNAPAFGQWRRQDRWSRWFTGGVIAAAVASFVLSYPIMFVIDRGNIETVMALLSGVGVWFYLRKRYAAAAGFWAASAATKIVPAILFALFFKKRLWKNIIIGAGVFALLNLAALAVIGPTVTKAYHGFIDDITYTEGAATSYKAPEIGYYHDLFSGFKQVVHFAGRLGLPKPADDARFVSHVYPYYCLAVVAAFGLAWWFRIRRLPFLNQLLALIACQLLLPPYSGDYKLLHVYIPWCAFLVFLARDVQSGRTRFGGLRIFAVLLPFAVLFTPQSYLIVQENYSINFCGQVKAVALLFLLGASLCCRMYSPTWDDQAVLR